MADIGILSGFKPIAHAQSSILILGSMPGNQSLEAQQYYAHPRNLFWSFMSDLYHFDANLDYPQKINHLLHNQVALWDVLQNCLRKGSLDSAIKTKSMVTNDFMLFFEHHHNIKHVYFNGKKAMHIYQKMVLPDISQSFPHIQHSGLPSTSPANTSLSRTNKFQLWSNILHQ